nr:hypothetical protein [Marinicella sp. W31]MDC2877480.1 hypothetical protein [Marinicella sp. W31]
MTSVNDERSAVLCVGRIYCDLIFTGLERMPVLGREIFAENLTIAAGGGRSFLPPISPGPAAKPRLSVDWAVMRFHAQSKASFKQAASIWPFWSALTMPVRR